MSASVLSVVESKTENELSPDAKYIGAVLDRFPQFYGGLERNIKDTTNGNVRVTFDLPPDKKSAVENNRPERALVLFQGGRNPPSGEYYQVIHDLLESGKVDSITVFYPPVLQANSTDKPIIDPVGLTRDLADLPKEGVVHPSTEVILGGVSIGADIAAFAINQGIQEVMPIKTLLLLEPVTLTEESTQAAIELYKKAENIFKRQQQRNRILATIVGGMTGGAQAVGKILKQYHRLPEEDDFIVKFDMPPNIGELLGTLKETIVILQESFQGKHSGQKIPNVHMYWANKDLTGLTSRVKAAAGQVAGEFGERIRIGEVDGTHGAIRVKANKESYISAIVGALEP